MTRPVWPTDPEFRRFAARVADAVTVAINSGTKIVDVDDEDGLRDCRCPMGCLTHAAPFPRPEYYGLAEFGALEARDAFIRGFDGVADAQGSRADRRELEAYYKLGRAYRRRFVEAAA